MQFHRMVNFYSSLSEYAKKFLRQKMAKKKYILKLKMFYIFIGPSSRPSASPPVLGNENVNAETNLFRSMVEKKQTFLPTSSPICHKLDIVWRKFGPLFFYF